MDKAFLQHRELVQLRGIDFPIGIQRQCRNPYYAQVFNRTVESGDQLLSRREMVLAAGGNQPSYRIYISFLVVSLADKSVGDLYLLNKKAK